jgi:hypothetical protein
MKNLSSALKSAAVLTASVSLLFGLTNLAQASESRTIYYTINTETPITEFQLRDLCNQHVNIVANKLTEVSARLTGNPTAMQVGGTYGFTPLNPQSPGNPNQLYRAYCYLEFLSRDKSAGFENYSAVHHTHLSNANWNTACKPEFDVIRANPNTLIVNYDKNATLFQGRICNVTTVQAVKN